MNEIKKQVQEQYSEIAKKTTAQNETSCCASTGCCSNKGNTFFSENYGSLEGYNPDADLNLGCGIPTNFAKIKPGDTVIDLGSGAGNDCFVARSLVGDAGQVIGIDFTREMIDKAMANAEKLGFINVQFRLGDIENLPVTANKADVVISNCVLNLVPDKAKAFSEIYRVLKPGGHISVSDIVLKGSLNRAIRSTIALYAGCISGALQYDEYIEIANKAGFKNIEVVKKRKIEIADEFMLRHISSEELMQFTNSGTEIYSITLYAEKASNCCCGCNC